MTYKERLQQEHPECVSERFDRGCKYCPDSYHYEKYSDCENADGNCEECWNREIPEQTDLTV